MDPDYSLADWVRNRGTLTQAPFSTSTWYVFAGQVTFVTDSTSNLSGWRRAGQLCSNVTGSLTRSELLS
jgi:hypothetical protein